MLVKTKYVGARQQYRVYIAMYTCKRFSYKVYFRFALYKISRATGAILYD